MKKDTEVKLYMQERRKGTSQRVAAARAGISERTGRTYECQGKLPSQRKRPHDWSSRPNPFEDDWPWALSLTLFRNAERSAIRKRSCEKANST